MRIVILGAAGLIGHKLYQELSGRSNDMVAVLHGSNTFPQLFGSGGVVEEVDVADFAQLEGLLKGLAPEVVLNCAGITKRRDEIQDLERALLVNSVFPHRLCRIASRLGFRVIHFSTDCVFDGSEGDYTEDSVTTARDTYGRTKALGEVAGEGILTIRSSFIGRELLHGTELLEWFLDQDGGQINGFTNVLYSGISTPVMARTVRDIIHDHPTLSGLFNLGTVEPISKYDLLVLARDAFGIDVDIQPDPSVVSRPTLDGSKLRRVLDRAIPDWPTMMSELAEDPLYENTSRVE
jgi:dTDP-4-dehydrorhamnose reductase